MPQFKKIEGDIKLVSEDGGSITVRVDGVRVPDGADEIGKYFGVKVTEKLSGLTQGGVEGLKRQVEKLEQSIVSKDAEIAQLEADVKTVKAAARSKRNTPAG